MAAISGPTSVLTVFQKNGGTLKNHNLLQALALYLLETHIVRIRLFDLTKTGSNLLSFDCTQD